MVYDISRYTVPFRWTSVSKMTCLIFIICIDRCIDEEYRQIIVMLWCGSVHGIVCYEAKVLNRKSLQGLPPQWTIFLNGGEEKFFFFQLPSTHKAQKNNFWWWLAGAHTFVEDAFVMMALSFHTAMQSHKK